MEFTYKQIVHEYKLQVADQSAPNVNKPNVIATLAYKKFTPIQEVMTLYLLDIKHNIAKEIEVSRGGFNTILITPREIFIHVLQSGCNRFILTHNHPSGDTKPSKEDLLFTHKITQGAELLGLQLLDHLIYTADDYYSFKWNDKV